VSFASERFASRRDTIVFLVCLLLGVGARAAPPDWSELLASQIRRSLLAPFLGLQQRAEQIRSSRADFDRVVAERDSSILAAALLETLQRENERLRSIVGLRSRLPVHHVAGEVLHQARPTDAFTFLVTIGGNNGVRPWAPVIAPAGLVGHIQTVDGGTAAALTWAHPEFRASATGLDGGLTGIVEPWTGEGPNLMLQLRYVPYLVEVPSGTVVYTSGLGGVYPRGIPIGRVIDVVEEEEGWSRTYLVEPAVSLAAVSHVLILLAEASNLSDVFASSDP
jgi:rod shape-determining protein MreC